MYSKPNKPSRLHVIAKQRMTGRNLAAMLLNGETGVYHPELFDFAFDVMTLAYYTNAELPEDLEECFALLRHTELCARIREAVDADQLQALRCAAKAKLDHLVRCAENTQAARLAEFLAAIKQLFGTIQSALSQINEEKLREFADNLAQLAQAAQADAVHSEDAAME